jgi:HECT-domain (ubiquitin-transferase)
LFYVIFSGSGGAGQGAPSANEQGGRSMRYPSGFVKPKTLWPVIGLRNNGDRVSFSPKVSSSYGVDGVATVKNILAVDEILRAYEKEDSPSLPSWFVDEAFNEYRRWKSKSWSKSTPRGSGPYKLTTTTFGSDLDLDSSHVACASACALLGMKYALLAGDRVKLKRSAGRILELAEEAVILGSFQGRLYYSIVSQKSEGGSLTEGGGRAWCFDESEVVHGLETVTAPKGLNAELPLMDRFTCTSAGGLRIVYEGGAVIRSDIEIFDGSLNLGTIPFDTVIPKQDVLERRVNSSGVVRYRVRHEVVEGWISARIRGNDEEQIVVPVEHANENEESGDRQEGDGEAPPSANPISYPTPGLCAAHWLENFKREQRLRGIEDLSQPNNSKSDVRSPGVFLSLATAGIMPGCTAAQIDSLLGRSMSKICDLCDGGNPLNAPFDQVHAAFAFALNLLEPNIVDVDPSRKLNEYDPISLQTKEAAATILSSWKTKQKEGERFPPIESIMARLAILRAFNRRIRVALPWMAIRPCQEGSGILGGLYGHGSSINRAGRSSNKILKSKWVQVSSFGSSLRKPSIRGLLFTSVKKELLQSMMEVTTTPTPLAHDEYELPREIRTVRINRIRARNIMKTQKTNDTSSLTALKKKYSVFSQLQNETKSWGGAGLRRGFVAKGHGGQKRAFKVKLIGEGCNDYSGPYREAFTDALSEITNTDTDGTAVFGTLGVLDPTPNNVSGVGENRDLFMFSLNGSDPHSCLPPHTPSLSSSEKLIRSSFASLIATREESSREVEDALVFLGRLTGTALRHGIALDLPLPLETVWKAIVEEEGDDEKELMEVDLLSWRNNAEGGNGVLKSPLLLWQQRMLNSFVDGLSNVLPVEVFSILTGEELREMICGNSEIDVDLLKRIVEYEGYEETDQVVQFFWEVLREFTNEERKSFLQFVWARNRLPLKEADFDSPFKIQKDTSGKASSADDESGPAALPSASTCFFALSLPPYKTKEDLKSKLLFAINNVATMETDFQTNTAEINEGYRAF